MVGHAQPGTLRHPRMLLAAVAVLLAMTLAALVLVDSPVRRALGGWTGTATKGNPRCPLNAHLVPRCGALLGVTPESPSMGSLAEVEKQVGRRFDLVYSFHDIDDEIPSTYDREVIASGAQLHITIDARNYGNPDRFTVKWADIAAGQYDEELTRQARGIASLGRPVFVTFDHEADQPSKSALGTPADYVAAWRHVHALFEAAGAHNAVWVWVMLGWAPSFPTAAAMWPGNDEVDWISWDAYDEAGCRSGAVDSSLRRSFAEVALPFLQWLHRDGPAAGIDIHKPLMISETGTVSRGDDRVAWFRGALSVLKKHPAIRAVTLWDHTGSSPACDFRFSDQTDGSDAVRSIAGDRWLNPLAP